MNLLCLFKLLMWIHLFHRNSVALLVPPIVMNTWNFTGANVKAWNKLTASHSVIDAVEAGCGQCEIDRCDGTVGWGGSPAENGETTLDAMIMDGETHKVGAVGGLRRIKSAISVARLVLERTNHSLLVGDMATQFALNFGFKDESLDSDESRRIHEEWLKNSCQPNYWRNVFPDPRTSCGPYRIPSSDKTSRHTSRIFAQNFYSTMNLLQPEDDNVEFFNGHDTIGMIAMDVNRKLATGTSTNGSRNKILGRVGDSPIPGAGSYASNEAGAAAATGDGDVIMRFLLSYQAVENLRMGMDTQRAVDDVISRLISRTGHPYPEAAVILLAIDGSYGAACSGFKKFPYIVSDSRQQNHVSLIECRT